MLYPLFLDNEIRNVTTSSNQIGPDDRSQLGEIATHHE
jgi:hypothetical protein